MGRVRLKVESKQEGGRWKMGRKESREEGKERLGGKKKATELSSSLSVYLFGFDVLLKCS